MNRDSRDWIAPVAVRREEVADTVDAGVDVYVSLAAARRAAPAGSAAFGKIRPGNRCAGLVVSLSSGVVRRRKQCDRFLSIWPFRIVHRKEAVIGRDEHRGHAYAVEATQTRHPLRHRLTRI